MGQNIENKSFPWIKTEITTTDVPQLMLSVALDYLIFSKLLPIICTHTHTLTYTHAHTHYLILLTLILIFKHEHKHTLDTHIHSSTLTH